MKLIQKLQEGGGMPFLVYTPTPTPTAQAQGGSSGSQTKEDKGFLPKDLINLIGSKGLPSDTNAFMNQINQFADSLGGNINDLVNTQQGYSMIISKLSELEVNKSDVLKQTERLQSNGGLEEMAISANGTIVVRDDKGEINTITLKDYKDNVDLYQPVTNNELLQLRIYDNNGAFNNTMSSILKNGVGIKEVNQTIDDVIKSMKMQKQKDETFMSPKQLDILKGFDYLTGIVKVKTSKESSRIYEEEAMGYLWSMMPPAQKTLLQAKAIQQGMDPVKGAMKIIKQNMSYQNQDSTEVSYDISDVDDGGSGSGSGGNATKDVTFQMDYVGNDIEKNGNSLKSEKIDLGGQFFINAPMMKIRGLVDSNSKQPLDRNVSIKTIQERVFSQISDASNVYFGDQKIPFDKLQNFVTTGETMAKMYLPINQEKYQETGEIAPDLYAAQRLEEANEEIKKKKITNPLAKLEVYRRNNVSQYVDSNVKGISITNTDLVRPFFAAQMLAQGSQSGVENINRDFVKKVERTDDVTRMLNHARDGVSKSDKKPDDYLASKIVPWETKNDIYKGYVFMLTDDNAAAAAQSGNNLVAPKGLFDNAYQQKINNQQSRRNENENRTFGSNVLN